jgi:hypothetical protein
MITFIITTLFIALVAAFATLFYSYCIGNPEYGEVKSGRILSKLGHWLEEKYQEHEIKESNRIKAKMIDQDQLERMRLLRGKKLNWYKALGICPVCVNPYITTIIYIIFLLFGLAEFHVLMLFSVLVFSSYITRISNSKLL